MVLPKTVGAAGCAHCQALDATPQGCPICARPICRPCAKDPRGCVVPHPHELRLGFGGRLREIDPAGKIGLYTRFGTLAYDLEARQQIGSLVTIGSSTLWLALPTDELLAVDCSALSKWIDSFVFLRLDHGKKKQLVRLAGARQRDVLPRELRRSERGRYALLLKTDESVDVIDTRQRCVHGVLRVAGQVLQACAASESAGLIVIASYGQLFVFGLDDCQLRGRRKLPDGDMRWLALGAKVVGAATEHGVLELLRIKGSNPRAWTAIEGLPPQALRGIRRQDHACISPDGRLLAVARGKQVELWSIAEQPQLVQTLQIHTDVVHFLRFSDDGQRLISADQDNRVVLWPRDGDRIVTLEDARERLALR